jgi:hypothetical protein
MLFEKEKDASTQEISHADEFANTRNAVFLVKKSTWSSRSSSRITSGPYPRRGKLSNLGVPHEDITQNRFSSPSPYPLLLKF